MPLHMIAPLLHQHLLGSSMPLHIITPLPPPPLLGILYASAYDSPPPPPTLLRILYASAYDCPHLLHLHLKGSSMPVIIWKPGFKPCRYLGSDLKHFPTRNSYGMQRRLRETISFPPVQRLKTGLQLLNIAMTASRLVLSAGDISLNSGAVSFPVGVTTDFNWTAVCPACQACVDFKMAITSCSYCDLVWHKGCVTPKSVSNDGGFICAASLA